MSEKYIVIYEFPENGYMECKGIFDNKEQAYGAAYLALVDGLDPWEYSISPPEQREGDHGYVFDVIAKTTNKVYACVTVLVYAEEDNELH